MGKYWLGLVMLVAISLFLLHYLVVGLAVYGDGRMHYSYARSIVVEGNLEIASELRHRWTPENNNAFNPESPEIAEGVVMQTMGPSLMWVLPMYLAHWISSVMGWPATGYADLYQISAGVWSIGVWGIGLGLLFKALTTKYSRYAVVGAIGLIWLTTNLFYYTSIDVLNTHLWSFSLAAIMLWSAVTKKPGELTHRAIFMGILLGLAGSNREQDILMLLPMAMYGLWRQGDSTIKRMSALAWIMGAGLMVAIPQLMVWFSSTNSLVSPRLMGANYWDWRAPHLWQVVMASRKSLIENSGIAVVGWIGLWFTHNKLAKILGGLTVLQVYLVACWWAWNQGEAYGMRMLIVCYPGLAWGLAEIIQRTRERIRWQLAVLVILAVVNWTQITLFMLRETGGNARGMDPNTELRIERIRRDLRFVK